MTCNICNKIRNKEELMVSITSFPIFGSEIMCCVKCSKKYGRED